MIVRDRSEAGERLAKKLRSCSCAEETVVVGITMGGMVVAAALAKALKLPLDFLLVQKIATPENPDLGIGAVSAEGDVEFNLHLFSLLSISKEYVKKEVEKQKEKAFQQMAFFSREHFQDDLRRKRVILVDEGVATGATAKAALAGVLRKGAREVLLAIPVGPASTIGALSKEFDEVVCLSIPLLFESIGSFYRNFPLIEEEEVVAIFRRASMAIAAM